ncbi:MAG: TonB-dependent receptor [Pirellulales bacterium]|nr:TonB-dependent receptor [Pirellulales bacterium]
MRFYFLALAVFISGMVPSILAQDLPASDLPTSTTNDSLSQDKVKKLDALLDLAEKDVGKLSEIPVATQNFNGTSSGLSNTLSVEQADFSQATSTGDLLQQIPSVSGRRLSGINVDPRVRGFNSSQLNASANGMTQYKAIQDIDSLLSQIDPGVIQEITVIEGPYTSLYGPGFAFINVDLLGPKRYENPEIHSSTFYNYSSNGQIMYGRENVWGGAKDWGMYCTYGVRTGNDYRAGEPNGFLVPTSFEKWDTMLSVSYDLGPITRLEFDFLHTEMNNVEMPGVVYDPENSASNQFNLRYIVQQDRDGPRDLLVQAWHQETFFHGDALRPSKQQSFYYPFITLGDVDAYPVNTWSIGNLTATGVRALRTFGEENEPQWTLGADWRRHRQRYQEYEVDPEGAIIYEGDFYGIPSSCMDDIGVLTHLELPLDERCSVVVGGRVDYAMTQLNVNDTVITRFDPDAFFYYQPGFDTPDYTLGMAYANAKFKLDDHRILNMGTSFAMRAPNLAELYSDEPYVPLYRFGNSYVDGLSTLAPEKNWQFDLGFQCDYQWFRCGARGFYATIWDYILAVPAYTSEATATTHLLGRNFQYFPLEWRYDYGTPSENGDMVEAGYQTTNIGLATLAGADLCGEIRIRPGVALFGCMSYVHGENLRRVVFLDAGTGFSKDGTFIPVSGPESLPNIYPFNGRISLRVFDPEKDRWHVEFITRLVNSQKEVAASLAEVPSSAFTVFDLRGYYRWRENLRFSLSLENLLNAYYAEPGSVAIVNPSGIPVFMPEPGFTVSLGVDGRF